MSKITELASSQINAADTLALELVEADETPAVVIIRWPVKATVLHPYRFSAVADVAARTIAHDQICPPSRPPPMWWFSKPTLGKRTA
jgi:hypothetical protein